MDMVCYVGSTERLSHEAWGKMRQVVSDGGVEFHGSLGSFASRLRRPRANPIVAILCIGDEAALNELLALRPLLNDLPLFVLLSDQAPEMVRRVHELRPRVILYSFWPTEEIRSVIRRFLAQSRNAAGAADPSVGMAISGDPSRGQGEAMR